jgi:hypothetical protein
MNAALLILNMLSFIRKSRLNSIGHINRMDSKRKVIQVLNNNSRGSPLRGRPKHMVGQSANRY